MTRPHPATASSQPSQAADTNHCPSESCALRSTHRPILEWESAWGTEPGTYEAPEHALLEAREMFQRTLAHWAMDVLRLRGAGLDRPTHPDRSLTALDPLPIRPASAPRRKAA
ncbi:MAG: hypothetical protein ACNA8P_11940 [Phycisphaerales bacterium]